MTCLVGVVYRGRCILAADSAVSSGSDSITTCSTPKVWQHGPVTLGVAGDLVARDAVRFRVMPPPWDGISAHAYVALVLAPEIRSALKAAGAADADVEMLVGIGGHILHLDSSCGATSWACGYGAAGSGADVALGALHATRDSEFLSPRERLTAALDAAAAHNSSVRAPWVFVPAELL